MSSYREFRDAAIYLVSMADFWKDEPADEKQRILDDPFYRQCHYNRLADQAARDIVWKAGYDFYYGNRHGYDTN